jgi:hypothetical protein
MLLYALSTFPAGEMGPVHTSEKELRIPVQTNLPAFNDQKKPP